MKKNIFLPAVILAAAVLVSCRPLSRTNPYDPAAANYINITYLGEAWYPENTIINAMAFSGGFVYVAGVKLGTGDCVIKLAGAAATVPVASASLGAFFEITDICGDDSGNIYIVDGKKAVQAMDASGNSTNFACPNMGTVDNLFIEWSGNNLFISNDADKKIYKYSDAGAPASPDSKILSCTANGYFTPGRIFKNGPYIYVVNKDRPAEVVRLGQDLSDAGTYLFERDISDCVETAGYLEVLCSQAVFRVDGNLLVALKWGDYGEGPGKIINGRLITYDASGKLIYILDGGTIKFFGE